MDGHIPHIPDSFSLSSTHKLTRNDPERKPECSVGPGEVSSIEAGGGVTIMAVIRLILSRKLVITEP